MKLHQLSVFLENKPGQLSKPCRVLADANINILTLSLADTEKFGILRIIVRDWKKARNVLEEAGCVVNVSQVIAIEVPDEPGGLARVLEQVEEANMNVEYMYAFTFKREDRAVLVFRFEDPDEALEVLQPTDVNVLDRVELYESVED